MSKDDKAALNGINIPGLQQTVEKIQKDPSLAYCEFRLHNRWVDGGENHSRVQNFYAAGAEQQHLQEFRFTADEPKLLEGKDQGANPVEFLLAGLSSCMTTTIAYYAALNGHKIKQMESYYKGALDLQGLLNLDTGVRPGYQKIQVHFKIQTDAPTEVLEKYYHFSPVYDVVSKSVPIEVEIETYQ